MAEQRFDLIIVGAGWYGLIAATTYLHLAPDTRLLILDDGKSIGGVWNHERIYPNLFAQVGHGLFEYSFYPMKKEGLTPDRYISGTTIHHYLKDFAVEYGLVDRIWLGTRVTSVKRVRSGPSSWHLNIQGQKNGVLEADKLIIASGVSSDPYIPRLPRTRVTIPIIHSAQIGGNLGALKSPDVKRVVVLGAAKSAYDAVFLLLESGKKVDWIIREDGTGPLAIMPPRLLGINTVDFMATRFLASFSPAILQTRGLVYKFLHKSSLGMMITSLLWRNVTRLAESYAGYAKSENAEKLRPIPSGYGIFWANSGLGLSSVPDFWKIFHAGDVTVHRTSITSFEKDSVHLANNSNIKADFVVLCTGWTDNLSVFDPGLRAEIGLPSDADFGGRWTELDAEADEKVDSLLPTLNYIPREIPKASTDRHGEHRPWRLYRRLVSPAMADAGDHSIFFPGQIHSVFTPLVAEVQALWGAAFLLGKLEVPAFKAMQEEIAVWNSWTKKRYLAQGKKHAYSIYDYLADRKQYIDTLARDLSITTHRKSNPITEIFTPYRPSDYRGLIDEYLATEQKNHNRCPNSHYVQKPSSVDCQSAFLGLASSRASFYAFLSILVLLVAIVGSA